MKRLTILTALLLMLITVTACEAVEADQTNVEEQAVPVAVEEARTISFTESVVGLGEIAAQAKYGVLSGVGDVDAIFIEEGDLVEEDQVLFELNAKTLQNTYSTTESQLRTVRDNLKSQLDDLKETLRKNEELYAAGALSQQALNRSKLQVDQTAKQYYDAVSAYNNQTSNLKTDLEDRKVKSPITGKVAAIYIEDNQSVQNVLAVEIVSRDLSAKAMVTADHINQMKVGGETHVFLDGLREKEMGGRVLRFNSVPDPQTGLYEVEIALESSDLKPHIGEFAEIEFVLQRRDAIAVPKKAVRMVGDERYVYTVKADRAVKTVVETGTVQGDWIEIRSGLQGGEAIVYRGQQFVDDGALVMVAE